MIGVLIALGGIFLILLFAELLWHQYIFRGEVARKFIHMGVGVSIAFWPLLMPVSYIPYIALLFLIVLYASKRLSIFKAMHNIERRTWGDILFAAGIACSALLVQYTRLPSWIFSLAILHLAVADGLAAVGGKFARHNIVYKTLYKQRKSVVGSLVFFLTSAILVLIFCVTSGITEQSVLPLLILLIPLFLTLTENLAVYGSDNIAVPIATVLLLMPFIRG